MEDNNSIDTLIIANISGDQLPTLIVELNEKHFSFTQISSGLGFLNPSRETILIGIQKERYDDLRETINKHCMKQVSHIATHTQLETYFQPSQPIIIEAETGGATILSLALEHFEQY